MNKLEQYFDSNGSQAWDKFGKSGNGNLLDEFGKPKTFGEIIEEPYRYSQSDVCKVWRSEPAMDTPQSACA